MISVTPLFQLSPTQTNEEVNTIKEATSRFGSPLNHRSLKPLHEGNFFLASAKEDTFRIPANTLLFKNQKRQKRIYSGI